MYGDIYRVCRELNCGYIIKITAAQKMDILLREVSISEKMGDIGVGPKVIKSYVNEGDYPYSMMISEAMDITMRDVSKYLNNSNKEEKMAFAKVFSRIFYERMKEMHKYIFHNDLHENNIMFLCRDKSVYEDIPRFTESLSSGECKFMFIDFGKSIPVEEVPKERFSQEIASELAEILFLTTRISDSREVIKYVYSLLGWPLHL
jgi:predicted unusual protein kinase regulating ubiquinone biosynthesis (AarF/ABC1/UbiB family)